jgi:hypothetical protein
MIDIYKIWKIPRRLRIAYSISSHIPKHLLQGLNRGEECEYRAH